MTLSWEEACARVGAPGSPFEIVEDERGSRRYKHAPPNLRGLFDIAREGGEEIFLVFEDERWSFNEVFAQVDALGDALVNRYGIAKGDRVAIGMRNYPEWVMSMLAIISVGGVSVSLNALWVEDEIDYALADSGASLLIADVERIVRSINPCRRLGVRMLEVRAPSPSADVVDQWSEVVVPGAPMPDIDVAWHDDATILYTSGTTGRPKGAVSTNGAIVSSVMAFGSRAAVDAVRAAAGSPPGGESLAPARLAFILIVPLFHVTGCVPVMLSCIVTKSKLVMMYRWNAEKALELIERERVTNFIGVPTQSWDLVNSPRFGDFDTSSLPRRRWWWCPGSSRTGRAGCRKREERWADPWLWHDRDQRLRAEQQRGRLRDPPDFDGAGDADHAPRDPRSRASPGADRAAWRDLVQRTDADPWVLEQARSDRRDDRGWLVA